MMENNEPGDDTDYKSDIILNFTNRLILEDIQSVSIATADNITYEKSIGPGSRRNILKNKH